MNLIISNSSYAQCTVRTECLAAPSVSVTHWAPLAAIIFTRLRGFFFLEDPKLYGEEEPQSVK